ncbi:hypothetical protein AYK24_04135 [Thermoplasmatales archaeon SG8-52-4]|nr:MAG: hypothetical protein AYK24_04135 [Thermoplasmatales archaeon SG8-52-4]
MRRISYKKLKLLIKNWIFWLILITGLAIIIRSIPAWLNVAWGCDFGIYYGITKSVAQSGVIFPSYIGWGSSYNYFPVLYSVNAFLSWITGIEVLTLMPKVTPIFGGLAVLVFYFFINQLIENKKIALLCTLFFAFMPFHVYQTSHASPLTMGHFFMMLSFYIFLKFRKNTLYIIPLIVSTLLLIMSHHLSTYFYLISLVGIVFVENVCSNKDTSTLNKDIIYIVITSFFVFSYWAFVAKTVYENFISGFSIGGIRFDPIFIILIFYVFLAFLFLFAVKKIRKLNSYMSKNFENDKSFFKKLLMLFYPFIKKKWPSRRSRIVLFILVLFVILGAMFLFTNLNMPWVGFAFTYLSIIYALPLVIAIAFGVAGARYTWFIKNGIFIRGWLIALLLSFVFMLITNNTTIFPHRHLEYIMAPLAILVVYGIGGFFSDPFYEGLLKKLKSKKDIIVSYKTGKIKIPQKNRLIFISVILILIISLASTTYAVHKALNASDERITAEAIYTIEWMSENLEKNNSMIASDHRLARMAEAEGFNTTKDETIEIWEAESLDEFIFELIGTGKNHSRITHIIIDDIMKNDVVHVHFGLIKYMTNETWTAAYDKFQKEPFEIVYRNETINVDPITLEPIHWAEVYKVNWTYIEEIYLPSIKYNLSQ